MHSSIGGHCWCFSLIIALLTCSAISLQAVEWCATTEEHRAQGFTNGTCFRYFTDENVDRETAKAKCASAVPGLPGDLAIIPTQFAQTTLYRNLLRDGSPRNFWIGVRGYVSPEWRWSDGRPLSQQLFTNWAPGSPPAIASTPTAATNKHCAFVVISDPSLQWQVDNCGAPKQFICEYKQPEDRPGGYQFVALSYTLDWYEARIECQREGGELLDMSTADQLVIWRNLTVQMVLAANGVANLAGKGAVWLGLSRQIWLWDATAKEVGWSNFSTTSLAMEPVQDCVFLSPDLDWTVTSCSIRLNYLCQFSGSTLPSTSTTSAPTTTVTSQTPAKTTAIAGQTTVPSGGTTGRTGDPGQGTTTGGGDGGGTTVAPPSSRSTTHSTAINGTTPEVLVTAEPQAVAKSSGGISEPYVIAIIVICIVCFIVIVIAILLACCGHIWLPRIRRRFGQGESYAVSPYAPGRDRKAPAQIDVAVTAHPSCVNMATGTSHLGTEANNSERDSMSLAQPHSTRLSAVYALGEPPVDIPEVYTSPTFLYSFPSHRPLEGHTPGDIDGDSSSSNLPSPSSTSSSHVISPAAVDALNTPPRSSANRQTTSSSPAVPHRHHYNHHHHHQHNLNRIERAPTPPPPLIINNNNQNNSTSTFRPATSSSSRSQPQQITYSNVAQV